MKITILTPTYNRLERIKVLWKSLQNQTSKEFEWLVIDDGSIDGTKHLIEQLQFESNFPIRYIYKANGGKHTALNVGIATIQNELTFIVDSDDELKRDAIETILQYHCRYSEDEKLCGYTFLRQYHSGEINGKIFKSNEMIASYIDARINADDTIADKAEVFFTKCLKEFPFPEYPNEKFLGEDLVWVRMARRYDMVHINEAIYVADYMEDGLTRNRRKRNINSPVGCMHRAEEFLQKDINLKYRIKGAIQYVIYGKFAGYRWNELLKKTTEKQIILLCGWIGLIIYVEWKRKYGKN